MNAHRILHARKIMLVGGLLAFFIGTLVAASPQKLASGARFDLSASPEVGRLTDGQTLAGAGRLERMNWQPKTEQDRGYVGNFSASHFAWNEIKVRFTPEHDGVVQLALMGPWEQASPGVLYQQEVLWGQVKLDGAQAAYWPVAWDEQKGWQPTTQKPPLGKEQTAALDGRTLLCSWHNRPLTLSLRVTGGMPVTLTLAARALVPPDFKQMRRITGRDTPAHRASTSFQHGANFGNYLEAPPGQDWGAKYTAEDFSRARAEGFDHVRLPIAWHNHAGPAPDFKLDKAIFDKVDFLVDEAEKNRLGVIVNVHHFDAFTSDPAKESAKFYALWKQIAEHYASRSPLVALELLNEPKDAATTPVLNPIYAQAIRTIRRSNPQRVIFVGPGKWNSVDELGALVLPDDDQNLIVTLHCYDPFFFTHQGANWTGVTTATTGVVFPGPPTKPLAVAEAAAKNPGVVAWFNEYNTLPAESNPSTPRAFTGKVQQAAEWSAYYGRPVHFGEFGAYIKADPVSRANYYRTFRAALDEHQVGWAIWDWKAGFRYWNNEKSQPEPGMHKALFPTGK